MPKNKIGGKKGKKGGNKNNSQKKKELIFKEDGQEYAQVTKVNGNGRFEVMCFDGKPRLGNIRGNMRKRVWINQGDFILIGLREFETKDEKCDIMHKYTIDDARALKAYGELPPESKINTDEHFNEDSDGECPFEFDNTEDKENELVKEDELVNEKDKSDKIDLDDI